MVSEAVKKYRQSAKGKATIRAYEQTDKCKATRKSYRQSEQWKIINRKGQKKYHQTEKGKIMRRKTQKKYAPTEKGKVTNKKFWQSDKGKLLDSKHQAKRKRDLGFTPLMSNPFPEEVPVDYHHINDTFVIPVPRQVHKSMLGKKHRIRVNDWIEEYIGLVGV